MPYCLHCQSDLRTAVDTCPTCGRPFSWQEPASFLSTASVNSNKTGWTLFTVLLVIGGVFLQVFIGGIIGTFWLILASIPFLFQMFMNSVNNLSEASPQPPYKIEGAKSRVAYEYALQVASLLNRSADLILFVQYLAAYAPAYHKMKNEGLKGNQDLHLLSPDYDLANDSAVQNEAPPHITAREMCDAVLPIATHYWQQEAQYRLDAYGLHKSDDLGELVRALVSVGTFQTSPDDDYNDFIGYCEFVDVPLDDRHTE